METCAAYGVLVAVHPWDIHGAHQAGLRTAWANRTGGRYPQTMHPADLEVTSLTALARIQTDARGHVESLRTIRRPQGSPDIRSLSWKTRSTGRCGPNYPGPPDLVDWLVFLELELSSEASFWMIEPGAATHARVPPDPAALDEDPAQS